MCGIIGYNGKRIDTLKILIDGLNSLEYRGYDSSGIAFKTNKINIIKSVGKVCELEKKIDSNIKTNIGIGHTRWATHGKVSELNSHPHNVGDITIVHNGIIENFKDIRNDLLKQNYKFNTETDTEVACALIDYYYKKYKDIKIALNHFEKKVRGSFALAIMVNNNDNLYAIRKNSPLIIAKNKDGNYISSDSIAISKYSNNILYLEENVIAEISAKSVKLFNKDLKEIKPKFTKIDISKEDADKCGYAHYMLKEIHDEPRVFKNTTNQFIYNQIESLLKDMPNFTKYNNIHIVACGSAYHAGLVGKYLIEEYASIPVTVEIASEYRYKKPFYNKKTLVIVVSQSGETADTLAALRMANDDNIDTLGMVNVETSTISRESKMVIYLKAGKEIAVATTKAYLAQITVFALIALNIAIKNKTLSEKEINTILNDINKLPVYLEEIIKQDIYQTIATNIYKNDNIFLIGRGIDYALAMEGALKLKEISYINCQGYAAGELKHGTISLIEKNTPVIGILTDDNILEKTISNLEEVKSRGALIVGITNDTKINNFDYLISIPKIHKLLQPILTILPLQLISYEVAKLRKCDIDKPKNLAKSVTVE